MYRVCITYLDGATKDEVVATEQEANSLRLTWESVGNWRYCSVILVAKK